MAIVAGLKLNKKKKIFVRDLCILSKTVTPNLGGEGCEYIAEEAHAVITYI